MNPITMMITMFDSFSPESGVLTLHYIRKDFNGESDVL